MKGAGRDVERYVARAARGLWGERRRIVSQEVRGALEDRIWKHQTGGCDPSEATRRALDDLGDPRVIARGMARVHALPLALQATALTAVLGTLGVTLLQPGQAQVLAAPYVPEILACDYSPQGVERLRSALGYAWPDMTLLRTLGQATLEAACREARPLYFQYLRQDSLVSALKAAGVRVTATLPADRQTAVSTEVRSQIQSWLSFPGSTLAAPIWKSPAANSPAAANSSGLVPIAYFVAQVAKYAGLPVTVEGDLNPTMHIGRVALQLGTPQTPVTSDDFLSYTLYLQLAPIVDSNRNPKGPLLNIMVDPRRFSSAALSEFYGSVYRTRPLRVSLPEGAQVVVLTHDRLLSRDPDQSSAYQMFTTRVKDGTVLLPSPGANAVVSVTDSFREYGRAFNGGAVDQRVMLLNPLGADRLDQVSYDVLPASTALP